MACGCAVVAANVGPVRELVTHGKNVLLVPGLEPERVAETVLSVLDYGNLSAGLRAGARRFAEEHLDVAASVQGYEKVIAELAGRKKARPDVRPAAPKRAMAR